MGMGERCARMKCPGCRKLLTIDHLRGSSACTTAAKSVCGMLARAKRPNDGKGGRPRKNTDLGSMRNEFGIIREEIFTEGKK